MARVAHWAQNQSLRHFITGLDIQNSNTPGAEAAVLNTFVLSGGDRWSNFIAWAAYAGSAIGAAWIASCFGASKSGQWLAAIFALTLPIGITEATSTMNDGVAAFWLLCAAAEIVSFGKAGEPTGLLFLGLAAGEAFLTKTTTASYLLPMGIWVAILAFRRLKIGQVFLYGVLSLLLVLALNAGFIARNLRTYETLFDPTMTELHSSQLRNWQGVTSNMLRTVGQQMSTPFSKVNATEYFFINGVHQLMRIDINDPRITSIGKFRISKPSFNEIRVTNPLHMLFILLALLAMLIKSRSIGKTVWVYLLVVFSGLMVYSYLFKWQIFGGRLHLSFFILLAPMVGYVLSTAIRRPVISQAAGLIFLILSLPWLFRIEQRPLVDNREGIPLAGKSLLDTPRGDWYFVTAGDKTALKTIATSIEEANCLQMGLVISGSSPEYLYWIALNAPRPDMRMEWITSNSATLELQDPSFVPCAVICESCGNDDHFNNLIKVLDNGAQQLFLEP
jgi:4-amino-4-deoxy-L-arabinose transferase-like glycosyltransferase